ncbi:MAG TPA: SxtJ family membrane protein [Polyangiaceae bacterium]
MKSFADIDLHPSTLDLRDLRWTLSIGGTAASAALWLALGRPIAAASCMAVSGLLCLLAFIPGVGRFVYIGWMAVGVALGMVTTPMVLGAIWVVLFLPMALVFRLVGRDPLRRLARSSADSYWIRREPPADVRDYFRQF